MPGDQQMIGNGDVNADGNNGAQGKFEGEVLPGGIMKNELVRLITQTLSGLGYSESANLLQKESSILLEEDFVKEFRQGVLSGQWDLVDSLIGRFNITNDKTFRTVKFLIAQQKFLELLERREIESALTCLRKELAPLRQSPERLHKLTSLIMCKDAEDVKDQAEWDGSDGSSREKLLTEFQNYISPSLLIPENRLLSLLQQSLRHQRQQCLYHNTQDKSVTLYSDHKCSQTQIPRETKFILEEHSDEIWYVQFSHNGKYLASASKDTTAIIWKIGTNSVDVHQHLHGHTGELSFLAWSPDDTMLLTCGTDNLVKLWDTKTGDCMETFSKHTESVTACAWYSDNRRFVTGGLDKHIYEWSIDGDELDARRGYRVNDLAVTPDGKRIIAICPDKTIRVFSTETREEEFTLDETDAITSLCVSRDGNYILVNVSCQECGQIHLWDLRERRIIRKYTGQRQGRFVIRSSFGGTDEAFIISGSEDSQVYVWHRDNGKLLLHLPGHAGSISVVAWNTQDPYMFASASDDHTIRIWGLSSDGGD
eukprot:GFYU01001357.1.p1 GENE.GFYU01001357.1~~GFYU01001357.1.p1  ORF type:complete len:538 (-),score=141.78 GFYU01001357.1:250-1863(-)